MSVDFFSEPTACAAPFAGCWNDLLFFPAIHCADVYAVSLCYFFDVNRGHRIDLHLKAMHPIKSIFSHLSLKRPLKKFSVRYLSPSAFSRSKTVR